MVDYKFCTVDQAKAYTKTNQNYAGHDELIQNSVILATTQIQEYCRRKFVQQEYTEYFKTPEIDTAYIFHLRELNVQTSPVPSIKLDYSYPYDWLSVADLDSQYYRINYEAGTITTLIGLARNRQALRVVYTAGYEADDQGIVAVPTAIQLACALQAAFITERVLASEIGMQAKRSKNPSITIHTLSSAAIGGLVPQAQSVVMNYRRPLISDVM